MTEKKPTFEEQMNQLQQLVSQLESGNVPLEEALAQFQTGIKLSQNLQQQLKNAENTVAKVINKDGDEVDFKRDDHNEHD